MDAIWPFIEGVLGLDQPAQALSILQVCARAVLIYLAGLVLIRMGEHRFLGRNTAFDIVLGFILGSTLSRAVNGGAPYFETLAGGAVLLGLHWLFSTVATRSDRADVLLNGSAFRLIEDGEVQPAVMRRKRINDRMLHESLRQSGKVDDPSQVEAAYFERNGAISVIPKKDREGPRIVEVKVEEGVQTVRIELV